MERPRVLAVDDEEPILEFLREVLTSLGYQVTTAPGGAEALQLVKGQLFDVVLLDIRMHGMSGVDLLQEIKRHDPTIDVVMVTGYPEVGTAVGSFRLGARDYLSKPITIEQLARVMAQVMERRLSHPQTRLRVRRRSLFPSKELVIVSPLMERIRETVTSVAPTDSSVLIQGESGTGKDLIAAAIHQLSPRREGPFIPVSCGAIPTELFESELFGHVRGSFSGAVADAVGLLRSASQGTLFLDEVTELPQALQVKLLRFLQDQEVRPIGSPKTYTVDVRIIAATNRQPEEAIKEGRFRQDLFYRLNVVRIVIPPLRERKGAIPALVAYFLRQFNKHFERKVRGITQDAMAALMAYDFPGNVRELENVLERAFALGTGAEITRADLDLPQSSTIPPRLAVSDRLPTLAEAERDLILRSLELCDNDKDLAARMLGISRRTFYRRLKEYGVLPPRASGRAKD